MLLAALSSDSSRPGRAEENPVRWHWAGNSPGGQDEQRVPDAMGRRDAKGKSQWQVCDEERKG